MAPASRPPRSAGHRGTSQPASNSLRCHSAAHAGMWPLDRGGSDARSAAGWLSSSHSPSSARNRASVRLSDRRTPGTLPVRGPAGPDLRGAGLVAPVLRVVVGHVAPVLRVVVVVLGLAHRV